MRAAAVLADKAGMEGMVGGQTLDLQGEGRPLDRAALERLQGLKTGALMEAAVTMGALVGGAGPARWPRCSAMPVTWASPSKSG